MADKDFPVVGAFMVPHPPIILPEVGHGEEKKIQATTAAYEKVADEVAGLHPDTIVISSPHTIMYSDYFHISPGVHARGDLSRFGAPQVEFSLDYDSTLADTLAVMAGMEGLRAGTEGEREKELDHGVMVPLYFIMQKYSEFRLLRVGLSGQPLSDHYRLGQLITKAAAELGRRIVYIASGDLSHKMKEDGPYGFAPEGPQYDERIMQVMGSGNFAELFDFDEDFCDRAAECGHRSFVMMAGALDGRSVKAKALVHEATFGVGYGICTFQIGEADENRKFLKNRIDRKKDEIAKQHAAQDPWVRIARASLESFVCGGLRLDDVNAAVEQALNESNAEDPEAIREQLLQKRAGAFVSLHKDGQLRGCIGTILPVTGCVAEELIRNAVSAATEDPRFSPVKPAEVPFLEYSVDVLGEPEDIGSKEQLDVKRYGVIVTSGYKRGLLLPDLDGVDTVEEQIAIASRKAGIRPGEPISLQRFEVIRHH